jgi:DNA replication and repair protein RecF
VRVTAVSARDFRNHERARIELGAGLTVLVGPNGAGKTNLLEALYFGCTGRSPRTTNEREVVRRGAQVARVTVTIEDDEGEHLIEVGFQPGEPKSIHVDGAPVESLAGNERRPLVSVFLPERLELVKGAPAARRGHLDQLVAAVWPSRAATRAAYSRALAQRNALLARLRAGSGSAASLGAWDSELAAQGWQLMCDRAEVVGVLAPRFADRASGLGLPEGGSVVYRPRSHATSAAELAAELAERHDADRERGFTAHGPHRDDFQLLHGEERLRSFGSQGQQRVALLSLLFGERDVLAAERGRPPLMLLDDVMSELDSARRELLADLLAREGQGVVTTTDLASVPTRAEHPATVINVTAGTVAPATGGVAA